MIKRENTSDRGEDSHLEEQTEPQPTSNLEGEHNGQYHLKEQGLASLDQKYSQLKLFIESLPPKLSEAVNIKACHPDIEVCHLEEFVSSHRVL